MPGRLGTYAAYGAGTPGRIVVVAETDIGPHRLVAAEELKAIVRVMCTAKGSSEMEAAMVADNLIEANLTGHDSHGIGMMPTYVESFLKGTLKLNQTVHIVRDA